MKAMFKQTNQYVDLILEATAAMRITPNTTPHARTSCTRDSFKVPSATDKLEVGAPHRGSGPPVSRIAAPGLGPGPCGHEKIFQLSISLGRNCVFNRSSSLSRSLLPYLLNIYPRGVDCHFISTIFRSCLCISCSFTMESASISQSRVKNDRSQQDGEHGHSGSHLQVKYMGTIADQQDMSALGKTQVLRVGTHHTLWWKCPY